MKKLLAFALIAAALSCTKEDTAKPTGVNCYKCAIQGSIMPIAIFDTCLPAGQTLNVPGFKCTLVK